ncbi:YwdI family protein [Robertmurraya sp. 2P01SA]|uniref:YwdI family protein n=1 Tax=Robertmurraya sp. 2P01SA TaxID=3132300 RepID=UPI0039A58352
MVELNISMQALLGKIEEELKQAKQSNSESRIREKIYAVKTLCELVLEQEVSGQRPVSSSITSPPPVQPQVITQYQQPQKMKVDADSNGDSLFDF